MPREYRLYGPPGTGKTTWLTAKARATERARGPNTIAIVSFTRAAAAELRGRDLRVEDHQLGTLHSFALRAIGRMPVIGHEELAEWNLKYPRYALKDSLDARMIDDGGILPGGATDGDRLFSFHSLYRAKMTPRDQWAPSVREFADTWDGWKQDIASVDFTDMIEMAYQDCDTFPGDPEVILADEAQDLSALELALLRKWGKAADTLVLCADDDQTIYEFKGASPMAFLDPPVPDEDQEVLSQSYRVPRAIQAFSQQWIEKVHHRKEKTYLPREEEGEIRRSTAKYRAPESLVRLIDDALQEDYSADERSGSIPDVMVLTSCAYMLQPLISTLRNLGYPFYNPYKTNRGDWNPLGPRGRVTTTVDRVLAYLAPSLAMETGQGSDMWTNDQVAKFVPLIATKGNLRRGAKKKLGDQNPEHLYRTADMDWLMAEIFEEHAFSAALDGDLDWLQANLVGARSKGLEFPMRVIRREGVAALSKSPRIAVGTIHSVKGGEAQHIILLPDLSSAGYHSLTETTEGPDAIRRTFYVGITRARHTLTICAPSGPAVMI